MKALLRATIWREKFRHPEHIIRCRRMAMRSPNVNGRSRPADSNSAVCLQERILYSFVAPNQFLLRQRCSLSLARNRVV